MLLQDSVCSDHEIPGTSGPVNAPVACTGSQQHGLFVSSSSGSPDRWRRPPRCRLSVLVCSRSAWLAAIHTAKQQLLDGSCLIAVCSPTQPYIDVWQLSLLQLLHSADLLPAHGDMHFHQQCPARTFSMSTIVQCVILKYLAA